MSEHIICGKITREIPVMKRSNLLTGLFSAVTHDVTPVETTPGRSETQVLTRLGNSNVWNCPLYNGGFCGHSVFHCQPTDPDIEVQNNNYSD